MVVSSSNPSRQQRPQDRRRDQSFGQLAAGMRSSGDRRGGVGRNVGAVGEKEISFTPARGPQRRRRDEGQRDGGDEGETGRKSKRGQQDRRSASGNVFRRM